MDKHLINHETFQLHFRILSDHNLIFMCSEIVVSLLHFALIGLYAAKIPVPK